MAHTFNALLGAISGIVFMAAPAFGQTPPADTQPAASPMAQCLIANAKPEHEQQLRDVMIDALKDDTQSLNGSALAMGMNMILLAQQSCGLKLTDLQSPEFKAALQAYGIFMGEKIFSAAMAKIGQ